MRRRLAVVLVCLSAGISALLGGSVAHAAGPPSKAHHGVTSVSFGTSVGSDCKLDETKENSKVPYGTGHLNVYLTFYHCVDIFGLRWEQYELYVDTSDGDLIWDVSYQDNLAVRVWLVGTYQGTTYGPQQNGELTMPQIRPSSTPQVRAHCGRIRRRTTTTRTLRTHME